ncbi:MAG: alpha-keto acid decarboxylase family protein [Burkholderiales bacterium]
MNKQASVDLKQATVGSYLLARLHESGVEHMFGVPGDYVLRFYDRLQHSPIRHIGTTREDTAAFAADGYARCRGIGALAVTYGVGALNVVNAIAGAYAESSPVVVISGAPGVREQREDPLLHHRFGPFTFQREIFQRITCATAVLDDAFTAFRDINRTLNALRLHRKPIYIELPRDMVDVPGYPNPVEEYQAPVSDEETLKEAVEETVQRLKLARFPVLLAGVELHRRSLQDALAQFVERANLPVVATLTGKSVIGERHPNYLGIYEGAMGPEKGREIVENADLLLMLGVTLNDVDMGVYTARLDPQRMVRASQDEVVIRHHRYAHVYLKDFLLALGGTRTAKPGSLPQFAEETGAPGFPETGRQITTARMICRLNQALTPDMMVVADTGDCLFAAIELRVHEHTEFLASAYYTTMGFSVPAALGAQIARPDRRALILVGDGAFQMTGTELATMARHRLNPVVIVFNNKGYATERLILDGPFNDISVWCFHRIGEVFGPMQGFEAGTEDEFEAALTQAFAACDAPSLINVHLQPDDASPAMQRLAQSLRTRVLDP